jgi:ubiquinol-cytochrome c reductase cytochrome b subunit
LERDVIARLVGWLDARLGTAPFVRSALRKAFPDHWSFALGEVNAYCFLILVVSGTYLALFFDPSDAYRSTVRLSFEVEAGLFVRQLHHWTALLFVAAILAHAARVFFTGAFRRPRELTWMLGVLLCGAAIFEGFAGYSLPGDLLSGIGLRIADSVALSIPVVGTWVSGLALGGAFPSAQMLPRLFVAHVYLLPAAIAGLMLAHVAIIWRQKHTQFRGPGRTEANVVGAPLFPNYALRSFALGTGVLAIVCALGAIVQINPVWTYGPYVPWQALSPAQPDWYLSWLEGALRLSPAWEPHIFGHPIPPVFWPGVVLPLVGGLIFFLWPFLERAATGDDREHNLLDRPSDAPLRTAIGVAALTAFAVLTAAGADDVLSAATYVSVFTIANIFRVAVVVLPLLFGAIAYLLANRGPRDVRAERTRIIRNAAGGYDEEPVA